MPKLTFTVPPASLMRELREVAEDAAKLGEELARANRLPADFPIEPLKDLILVLRALPEGTAEGCRVPLEQARSRLPAIRRTFIQTEEQSRQPRPDDEVPPPLTRGMVIDQRLGALVNSVATALDEYRDLASVVEDEPADTAPSIPGDATAPEAVAAMDSARNAEQALNESAAKVDRLAKPDSVRADDLKRQMRDAGGLLGLARVELRMPDFVPRWYRKTLDTLKDYPNLLMRSVQAIEAGVDVAQPLMEAWSQFKGDVRRAAFGRLRQALEDLKGVGRKWEANRSEPVGPPSDFDLQAAHSLILAGKAPPVAWRPWIDHLNFYHKELADLAPLSGLSALETLDLDGTQVSDLTPLSGLPTLQVLDLRGTPVRDLAPLSALSALETLYLNGTQVSDLAPLSALSALERLYLNGTPVSDLAPLADLDNLRSIHVGNEARRMALAKTLGRNSAIVRI